jgi:hypothetical protein
MLDDIMKFIYIKMGDIEVEISDDDEEFTKEELADLDNIKILSVE